MRMVKSLRQMQRLATGWKRSAVRVGFVPTMGYLHAGHMSLVHQARKLVGTSGKVVVSIYVNPAQFGPREDFSKYPRDLKQDARSCRKAGVDVVFIPADEEMYPRDGRSQFSTYVTEETLSRGMEGSSRPTHFRGVSYRGGETIQRSAAGFRRLWSKRLPASGGCPTHGPRLEFPLADCRSPYLP